MPGWRGSSPSAPADDRPALVERALRIGLAALQEAGVTVNVDAVRREFESLLTRRAGQRARRPRALDEVLRQNFADGDGRLPRTLEKFLGDRGRLRAFVTELFDESKRDSAIGRMKTLLGSYFDGDASRLALLLDPTRMNSPLHQFRAEVSEGFARLNDRLTAIEAAAARARRSDPSRPRRAATSRTSSRRCSANRARLRRHRRPDRRPRPAMSSAPRRATSC